ncbi:hypothetical protein L917_01063 [Phytophthora nicotianae]|uniref:Uncharacterized protein n=1 Tax=Phytophthora nicotianae TaxID=4792 RepID=W2LY94_PHYNI|nr:hypothetical protein L917_01063 [Phytophthora nicotianae]ETM55729.1 hypothetical protein L914_01102 [Phytophthora nicotianae]
MKKIRPNQARRARSETVTHDRSNNGGVQSRAIDMYG